MAPVLGGGTGLGGLTVVRAGAARITDGRHRLRLERLSPKKAG